MLTILLQFIPESGNSLMLFLGEKKTIWTRFEAIFVSLAIDSEEFEAVQMLTMLLQNMSFIVGRLSKIRHFYSFRIFFNKLISLILIRLDIKV
jgi:hypothetical protein